MNPFVRRGRQRLFFQVVWVVLGGAMGVGSGLMQAAHWPSWRGPNGDSSTSEQLFPLEWAPDKNIKWKVELGERGNASPIVWGDRVFLAQPDTEAQLRSLLCFDRRTGERLWRRDVRYARPEAKHETNTYCAASPVTDGERVYVQYGSAGFYCYDLNGRELWHRNLGLLSHQWGIGSSPVLDGDLCILFHGPGSNSRLIAMDKRTGTKRWEVAQPAFTAGPEREDGFSGNGNGMVGTFCTPMVVRAENRTELVMIYPETIRAYNPASGQLYWQCGGINPLVYCSPLVSGDQVIGMGGYFGPMISVRLGGDGDVTESRRLWKSGRTPHRLGTGVTKDGYAYVFDRPGMAQCIDLATGRSLWQERVRGAGANRAIWGSAVLAGEFIFTVNQSGETIVMRASPDFELLGVNPLGEKANTTPALSQGEIFIRTDGHLWCIADLSRTASIR